MPRNQNLLALLFRDILVYKKKYTKNQVNMKSEHSQVIFHTVEWIIRI